MENILRLNIYKTRTGDVFFNLKNSLVMSFGEFLCLGRHTVAQNVERIL